MNFIADASECPEDMGRYSTVQDKLKAMEFIKPSVLQDVAAIVEKFPCEDRFVTYFVEDFVSHLKFHCLKTFLFELEIVLFIHLGGNSKSIACVCRE